jgi:hypothetical protein
LSILYLVLRQPSRGEFCLGGGGVMSYPKRILKDLISTNAVDSGIDLKDIHELAHDKDLWKSYLKKISDEEN